MVDSRDVVASEPPGDAVFKRGRACAGCASGSRCPSTASSPARDEMEISLVPALVGGGERLFDGVADDLRGSSWCVRSPRQR